MLVVDDNESSQHILEAILTGWGVKTALVDSGSEALSTINDAKMSGNPFTLALIDAQMPEMDGFALAERLKKDAQYRGAMIMMLTSLGQMGEVTRCQDLGIGSYLSKPVSQSELLDAILKALGARASGAIRTGVVPNDAPHESQRQLRILLAEDNAVNHRLALRFLEKSGHSVVGVHDGSEALATLEKAGFDTFDLVLMDIEMPRMDGFEATAAIRAKERTSGKHLPILAMTAHAMKGDRERCLEAGMDGYISKPIKSKELAEIIAALALASPVPAGGAA